MFDARATPVLLDLNPEAVLPGFQPFDRLRAQRGREDRNSFVQYRPMSHRSMFRERAVPSSL
jgi:hypothetical protein